MKTEDVTKSREEFNF